jgi:hypothetical protein
MNADAWDDTGIAFRLTEAVVKKLRDDAIEAAIEADVRKTKWIKSAVQFANRELMDKHGIIWEGTEGVIEYSDGNEYVKLDKVSPPLYEEIEPQVEYRRRLKNGKWSKTLNSADFSYVMRFFRANSESGGAK